MLISTLLDGLYERVLRLTGNRFRLVFLGAAFLAVIFINGLGTVPEEPYRRLAENPFVTRTDIHFNNYWQENPLLPVLAHFLRLTTDTAFNLLCLALLGGAFFSFALWSARRWDPASSFIFSILLITSPITTVILSWLGTPDSLSLALTVPFLFTRSVLLVFSLAVLGAANHPAFMIATLEILVLRWAARDGVRASHLVAGAAGQAAGFALVRLFLHVNQIEVVSRMDFMLLKDLGEWLAMNARNFPISFFSLFNVQWLVVVLCMVLFFKRDRVFYSLVAVFLLVNYTFTFFTLDTTRIFSLLSWGVLFECMFHSYKLAGTGDDPAAMRKQFLQALVVIGAASFFAPRYFSWVGEIHTTPFYEFLQRLLR